MQRHLRSVLKPVYLIHYSCSSSHWCRHAGFACVRCIRSAIWTFSAMQVECINMTFTLSRRIARFSIFIGAIELYHKVFELRIETFVMHFVHGHWRRKRRKWHLILAIDVFSSPPNSMYCFYHSCLIVLLIWSRIPVFHQSANLIRVYDQSHYLLSLSLSWW